MKKSLIATGMFAVLSIVILSGCGESTRSPNDSASIHAEKKSEDIKNATFTEGVHYELLEKPLDRPANNVIEVFSFACPHCYDAEIKLMTEWKESSKDKYTIEVIHSGYQKWYKDAEVFYSLKAMEREDVLKPYFDARQAGKIINDETFYGFLAEQKVNKKPYDVISSSNKIKDAISNASKIEADAGLNGVPAFVVSGKYRIKLDGIKNHQEIKDISEYLMSMQP